LEGDIRMSSRLEYSDIEDAKIRIVDIQSILESGLYESDEEENKLVEERNELEKNFLT
jgi:hypothetical protein